MSRIDELWLFLWIRRVLLPLFRWRERDYQVSSKPVRWFARTEWWLGERAHRGIGSGVVKFEMWRFIATVDGFNCHLSCFITLLLTVGNCLGSFNDNQLVSLGPC